jgi:hypothetical protein
VVPIEIKVLCIIYKFGANILTFNKLFIIGRSIVSFYVSKMVMAIDVVFKEFMMWPIGDKMKVVMMELKNWCGMRSVISIDKIHIAITKPYSVFKKRVLLLQN